MRSAITMFSHSSAPGPGDQRSFKPHTLHLFPWLRTGLKPQPRGNLGLNGPYKHPTVPCDTSAPLERAKGLGFLSKELMGNLQGKDREVKRCNGVGLAKSLPVVLREHQVLPETQGRRREDSPARWSQSPELDPDPGTGTNSGQGPQGQSHSPTFVHDYHSECSFVRSHNSHFNPLHSQGPNGSHTSVKKCVPLTPAPVPTPAPPGKFKGQEPNYKVPVVVCTDEGREKLWRYARHTYHRSDRHLSTWLSSDSQGLIDGQQGFSSGFGFLGKNLQSQADLTRLEEPTGEAFSGPNPLHGVIFSTEVPTRHTGSTTTLRGPRKPRPVSEHGPSSGQNQRRVRSRPASGGDQLGSGKDARQRGQRCNRKAVRDQIKRVVDNLEQVLGSLKDVHQEMKEVVEQIEYLTSSIDLNEEEEGVEGGGGGGGGVDGAKPPSESGSSSSGVTVGSNHQNPHREVRQRSAGQFTTIRKHVPFNHVRSQSPPSVLLQTQSSVWSSENARLLHLTHNQGSSSRRFGPPSYPSSSVKGDSPPRPLNLTSKTFSSPPRRTSPLPVRPPTPGPSPLTVNLHPSNNTPGPSPGPQPHSPGPPSPVSPLWPLPFRPPPPPALSPSVIIETKAMSYRTPYSGRPSASTLSLSSVHPPSPSSPPKDSATQPKIDGGGHASSAGPVQLPPWECVTPLTKAPLTQGRRGRKPPPYPHDGHFEQVKRAKEPREAPPYPEKRRLLSTTV